MIDDYGNDNKPKCVKVCNHNNKAPDQMQIMLDQALLIFKSFLLQQYFSIIRLFEQKLHSSKVVKVNL